MPVAILLSNTRHLNHHTHHHLGLEGYRIHNTKPHHDPELDTIFRKGELHLKSLDFLKP
jgi:hypothetical protein